MDPNTFNEKLLDTLQCLGAVVERAGRAEQEKRARDESVRSLIPAAVEALFAHGKITAGEKSAMARALTDHGSAIEYLTKLAAQRSSLTEAAPERMGSEVSPRSKTAASQLPTNRRRGEPRASERAWAESLGIPIG